jgi:phage tail tape-measure protein
MHANVCMRTKKKKLAKNHRTEAIVAASGTVAGAIVGSIAGPVGAVAGAIVGSLAGATAGAVLEHESQRTHQHD